MADKKGWFRDKYADAVWETEALRPNEKLVALVYADHAGDKEKPDNDIAWVTWPRLSQWTGIRSKDGINRALRGLEAAGWLVEIEKRRQHRSARYRLVIPECPEVRETYVWEEPEVRETDLSEQESNRPDVRDTDHWDSPEVRETTPEVRETTPRGTRDGPDFSKEPLNHTAQPMAHVGAQPQDRAREADEDISDGQREHWKSVARAAVLGITEPYDPDLEEMYAEDYP
jgi:hypothetical protein